MGKDNFRVWSLSISSIFFKDVDRFRINHSMDAIGQIVAWLPSIFQHYEQFDPSFKLLKTKRPVSVFVIIIFVHVMTV